MQNSTFADHFQSVFKQIAAFFPSGLPAMTPEDWEELHGFEDRINELWLAEEVPPSAGFREAVGKYKMFWFKKRRK